MKFESKAQPKAMWTVINSVRNTAKKSCTTLDPNVLNAHFVDHPIRIVGGLPAAVDSPLDICVLPADTVVGFSLSRVSGLCVRQLLESLKVSGTKDSYGVTSKFIKNNISLYVEPLTKLINSAIDTGEFPDLLKSAYVIPVHKGGDTEICGNYRPISILPVFSKVYERAIYNQIASHLEVNSLLSPNQYGFRKGRNTEGAVVKFTDSCLKSFDSGQYCFTLLLDLSRAFDCVSHQILLNKLKHVYQFDHLTLKTINSYLTERRQSVLSNGKLSDDLNVSRGVPQGSILGPLLFLIFFNDFPYYLERDHDIQCFLYADDATVTIQGPDMDDVLARSEVVLSSVRKWAIANELSLNEDKTVKLAFGLKQFNFQNPEPSKFLGVYIAPPDLKFGEHARVTGSKISRNIFLLRRLATAVTHCVCKTAYYALIHSHICYCILAWGNSPASHYLFRLQRRAVRVVANIGYRDDCRECFVEQSILTLPSEYILASILYANQNKATFETHGDVHRHDTRGRHKIRVDQCRTSRAQNGPLYICKVLFNKLPASAKNLTNPVLKKLLKAFLTKNAFYSIDEFLNCESIIL